MGIRFRKSINLGGFRVNLSKKGVGYSVGVKGARITKTADGKIRKTLTIPNTGISYVTESGGRAETAPTISTTKPYRLFAIVLRITGVLMIVLGALLTFALAAIGLSSIAIGVCELVIAKKYMKKYKQQEELE